jgi:hypothetical protein
MRYRLERKERKKKKGMAILMGIILLMTVVGFTFGANVGNTPDDQNTINGYSFTPNQEAQIWEVKNGDLTYEFHFLPNQVAHTFVDGNLDYSEYILVSDPKANLSEEDLAFIDVAKFEAHDVLSKSGKKVTQGFAQNYSCRDSLENVAVVMFENGTYTEAINEDNCIHLKGITGLEILKAKEMFLYRILGIS